MLTITPQGGLCNRLRVLFSAIQAANNGVRPIEIHWARNPECCAWFEELFLPISTPSIKVVHRKWWALPRTRRNLHLPEFLRYAMGYFVQRANCVPEDDTEFYSLAKAPKVYLSGCSKLCSYDKSCVEMVIPEPSLKQRIDSIVQNFSAHTIGVHIRRTDNVVSIEHSTNQGFMRAMDRALEADSKANFFLATDDAALKRELIEKYGDIIITQQAPVSRSSIEGMRDAVVDLWCLASASRIIGSYWSSFSDTAAELFDAPLEIVMD